MSHQSPIPIDHALRPRWDDRRLVRDRSFVLRWLTAPLRALPDFLIIGEMKCGTTSLFHYLCQHPQVYPPVRKELHYFGDGVRHGKGSNWYRAHFPRRSRLGFDGITGEATPGYLSDPDALSRLAWMLPRARLIVLLRDPVERAISHYYHEVRMGREHLPIEAAMHVEEERLAGAGDDLEGIETRLHASYKRRGIYADSLERLFGLYPREQVLVLGSGTLFAEPIRVVERVLEFLELPPMPNVDFRVWNKGDNREEVPQRLRMELEAFFAPHNSRLFDLLGERPDWGMP